MKRIDKRRKQVLIIECDSFTLENQDLAVGEEIKIQVQGAFEKNGIDLIKAFNKNSFDQELDVILRKYSRPCKTIVLVGHSNQSSIKLTSDLFVNWQELGERLEPFLPEQLIFLACQAGDILACEVLFESIPSLQQIFASPVNVSKSQQDIIIQKILYTLAMQKENSLVINLFQLVSAVITKEWMFSRTREEYEYGELDSKKTVEKGIIMITNFFN